MLAHVVVVLKIKIKIKKNLLRSWLTPSEPNANMTPSHIGTNSPDN